MKKVLIVLAVLIVGCKDNNPVVIYVNESNVRDSVEVDFNVQKDQWINHVLNTQKGIRHNSIYGAGGLGSYTLKYPAITFEGYRIGEEVHAIAHDSAGNDVLFDRNMTMPAHRVSKQTEDRIYKLLFK
jgi:hypothetical protein